MEKGVQRNVVGTVSGIVLAALLIVAAFCLYLLLVYLFPSLKDFGGYPWTAWITVMALPETIIVWWAIRLWRSKRPMAIGVLICATLFATHFAKHILDHWRG